MCITEEEFRIERKRAMEVLEELKALERSLDLVTLRIDAKTVKSVKREEGDAHGKRRRTRKRAAQDGFFDITLEGVFDSLPEGEWDIFCD